ncbi:MAG: tetratricopeptide repeat protein [Hyphomonadaceae bacterium]|nr:tetratricopeptide repeat protein [Hyphomonadaceae bacterium]
MRRTFIALALAAGALAAAPLTACSPAPEPVPVASDPALDELFTGLLAAPTAAEAGRLEQQIWQTWGQSGSATVDILIERADAAEAAGDKPLALRFVNQATELAPSYAGGWYRRSILRYDADDRGGAIADIEETLKREPRHFGALAGLGMIYEDMGQEKAALEAYRRALEIHPFLDAAKQGVARLEPKIEGQDL